MSEYYIQVLPFTGIGDYGGWYESKFTLVAKDQVPSELTVDEGQSVFMLQLSKKSGAIVSRWNNTEVIRWGWGIKNRSELYVTNPQVYLKANKNIYKMDGSVSTPADYNLVSAYSDSMGNPMFFKSQNYSDNDDKNPTYYSYYYISVTGSVINYTFYFVGNIETTPKIVTGASGMNVTPAKVMVENSGVMSGNGILGGVQMFPNFRGFPELSKSQFNYLTWFNANTSNALSNYFKETEPKQIRTQGDGYSEIKETMFGNNTGSVKYLKMGMKDGKFILFGEFNSIQAAIDDTYRSNCEGVLSFRCQAGGGAGGGNGWNLAWSAGAGGGGSGAFGVTYAVFKSGRYVIFTLGSKAPASASGKAGSAGGNVTISMYEETTMIGGYRFKGGGGGGAGGAFNSGGSGGYGGSTYYITADNSERYMSSTEATVKGDNPFGVTKRVTKNSNGEVCLILADWVNGGAGGRGGNGSGLAGERGYDGNKYNYSEDSFILSFVPNTSYKEKAETNGSEVGKGGDPNGTFSGGGGGGLPWRGGKGGNGAKGGAANTPTDAAGYGAGGGGASGGIGTPVYGSGSAGGPCMVEVYI